MSYIRHDKDNNVVSPQPSSTTVIRFSGTEGWSTITYNNWNRDYIARNFDNTTKTPGTYQARTADNTPRTPSQYQRHDSNNNSVLV